MTPRVGVVLQQFRNVNWFPSIDAPSFNQHGGEVPGGFGVTMNAPAGVIYYTTDRSDPRRRGGGISPSAKQYIGTPVVLNNPTQIKARALDGGEWSALNEAIFAVGPVAENLRITEIMYHPMYTGSVHDPNEEYIELTNIGMETINLNLARFTEGIQYTFPDVDLAPGQRIVVVKNHTAFQAQYGAGVNTAAGEFIGSLANNGERIRLEDAIGRTILDFEYKDGWRSITDGGGFSLTMIEPTDNALSGPEEGLVAYWKFDDGSGNTA